MLGRNKTSPSFDSTGATIVALDDDFLGTLGDAFFAIAGFSSMRRPAYFVGPMNRLYVFEGGNEPDRQQSRRAIAIRPSHWPASPSVWCVRFTCKAGVPCPRAGPSALEPSLSHGLPEARRSAAKFRNPGEGSVCGRAQIPGPGRPRSLGWRPTPLASS